MRVAEPTQTVAELLSMLDKPGAPPILLRDDQHSAMVISQADYEKLRVLHIAEFDRACAALAAEAKASGLTEDVLNEILAEIDAETPR